MSEFENLLSSELWSQGRKLYILQNYAKALECLSKACKLISLEKGDTCDELFEPYLCYSKCLYMYTKMSNDNIGDDVNDEDKDQEKPALVNVQEEADENDNVGGDVNDDKDEEKPALVNVQEDADKNTVAEDEVKIASDNIVNEPNDDEEVGYLEMAYETVECAKLIIKRQREEKNVPEKDLDLRLAECCDIAGDIYIEEEVMKEAIEQYETALRLRQAHLPPSDRAISESHYKMAVAFNINYQMREAREHFEKCRDVLVNYQMESGPDLALADVLAEIEERIKEAQDGEAEFQRAKESLQAFMVAPTSGGVADDISHLVKRVSKKRPATDDELQPADKAARTSE